MNTQDESLLEAKKDFRYLLNRAFPRTGALKFVGDHYLLDETQRNYLNRTVFSNQKMETRKRKLILLSEIKDKYVLVDGYNVLITTESVCKEEEELLVDCDDGVTRDVKAVFGKYKENKATKEALTSIILLLKIFNPEKVLFFYDSPVSLSGELARTTQEILKFHNVPGDAQTAANVDGKIIQLSHDMDSVVATSDGIIIDKVNHVLDIPGYVSRARKK
ncbi:DUF434 domain-containing protein [Methanobacterium petrolearium]|uniref:DUF434 domain-containing protein n=1 Tax=Methanobacterium petrolearium TaxID=710190 RepID=UPI001AE744B4|nr:DUF434 domain-containing protein [Methanobacterium petrolearium]MBP1946908.1 hypothetical protein [Methanobacterium petrolearium]BDZ72039.1 hypothetical protein GCM10025861_25560 [Methanobacterium petrolearium]